MAGKMTSDDARQYLRELFARAGKPDGRYRTDEEAFDYLSRDGAQKFKRKALGLCRSRTLASLDEIAQLLFETGVVSDVEEGRQIVPKIVQANDLHSHAISRRHLCTYLAFDEVENPRGDLKYRISAWTAD